MRRAIITKNSFLIKMLSQTKLRFMLKKGIVRRLSHNVKGLTFLESFYIAILYSTSNENIVNLRML